MTSGGNTNRYTQIIENIFLTRYQEGDTRVCFEREDIAHAAAELGIKLPKNLGDLIYSFRYRARLPASISKIGMGLGGLGKMWVIRSRGRAKYCFELVQAQAINPNPMLIETKVPDATPGIVAKYSLNDEQALLAKLRYNRLIDIFTGVTCYSLQNHLRTTVPEMGQVETDEIYVGLDKRGAHYVFPVQAKSGSDQLGTIQVEQDFDLCRHKFPHLICRPIGAQLISSDKIALFELAVVQDEDYVRIAAESHYRLVLPEEITPTDLDGYSHRP
jgi:hypothetical protein